MAEFLTGGPPDRSWRPPRWAVVLGLGVVLAGVLALAVVVSSRPSRPDGASRPNSSITPSAGTGAPTAGGSSDPCSKQPVGVAPGPGGTGRPVAGLLLPVPPAGGTLDRRDPTAASGPWAVLVRRPDGSLGRHSAVVTFPVAGAVTGRPVPVGQALGRSTAGEVNWPVAGAHARVRGNVDQSALLAIASGTRIVARRPVVKVPVGYRVAASGPYRSPHVHEVRYDGSRAHPRLSGLLYTGVASVAGFEDQLYATAVTDCGTVSGHAAVVSAIGGGNGALAWETAPGLVGYVGYSGSELTGPVLAAIDLLARQSQPIDDREWQATSPQIINQRNDW